LTGSKLELLIESLAAGEFLTVIYCVSSFIRLIVLAGITGTEVFSDGRGKKDDGSMEVDEIGVVLGD